MSKEPDRVVTHETQKFDAGVEIRVFKRVEIKYTNGDAFYSGWIQDFGSALTGPTFFDENYDNYSLQREIVCRREKYWTPVAITEGDSNIRIATLEELDEIIDLNFQNYFEGGYNRISAYQGLNFLIDNAHEFLVYTINDEIFGFLYLCWNGEGANSHAYFDSLYVAPCVRDKGIGSALVEAGLGRAQEKGCKWADGCIIGPRAHCEGIAGLLTAHGFGVTASRFHSDRWIEVDMRRSF